MVSVIIPLYNVCNYIDKCLASVVNQTNADIEILLIDDGSTDGTSDKCQWWAAKDSRIRYYYKENEGPGPARELGARLAVGDYIYFVDADDWIAEDTVELLMKQGEEWNADIVICDHYLVDKCEKNGQKELTYTPLLMPVYIEKYSNAAKMPELIYRCDTASWDKLFRRTFWIESGLSQQTGPYVDDTAVIPLLMAQARRIAQVRKCLYYYYVGRKTSITGQVKNLSYILESLQCLQINADRLHLLENYRYELEQFSLWMIKGVSYHFRHAGGTLTEEQKKALQADIMGELTAFMDEIYPSWNISAGGKWLVWGSYNLRSVVAKFLVDVEQIRYHYSFSSILSIENHGEVRLSHPNAYRQRMLCQDVCGSFAANRDKYVDIDYVAIDFLEERFDMMHCGEQWFTKSDAWDEAEGTDIIDAELVLRESVSEELWERKCLMFIRCLQESFSAGQIYLVRSRLHEQSGNRRPEHDFEQVLEIRAINDRIKSCEDFFIAHYPGIHVVELPENRQYLYTDERFIHGCYPHHGNEMLYNFLADRMIKELRQEER